MSNHSDIFVFLEAKPLATWTIRDSVLLDWHDGVVQGIYEFSDPAVTLLLSQTALKEANGIIIARLYAVQRLPPGTVEQVQTIIQRDSPNLQHKMEAILATREDVPIFIQSGKDGTFHDWWFRTYFPEGND